jgi:hypothetical protein
MIIIYIIFFALLNFIIFHYLTKKVELSNKLRLFLIATCILILFMHYSGILFEPIANNHFYHLMIFSLVLFVVHIGSYIPILAMKKVAPNFEGHFALTAFNFMRFYVIYILIFVYQCTSLLSSTSREHFKSIESIF